MVLRGTVRGNLIELEQPANLPDGQQVTVVVQPVETKQRVPGQGILESAGAWAEGGEELDRFIEWTRQQRKLDRDRI
ncbi:MAG TPA: hypothetical protein VF669_13760 [Tepidisphaeraceae bacterium]|jgi:hypothetical protein